MAKEMPGTTFDFQVIAGEVVGTDQRSDSVTTGSSRTVVYQGTGGGSGHVSTEVVVNRDIWFRTADGHERHVRIQFDVPVRVGQHVALVYLKAKRTERRKVDELFSVYVLSTDRYWALRGFDAVANALAEPEYTEGQATGIFLMWVVCLGLCFLGIGIPLVIGLHAWEKVKKKRIAAIAADIAAAMKTEHDAVLGSAYRAFAAEQKRLAAIAAQKSVAIGAAS